MNIRLKLKGEFEQLLKILNQLKSGPRLLVLEKLQLENTAPALLENKDLRSLTKSPSKPGTSRKKYSSQKKKQVLKQNVIAGVQEKLLIQKADFSLRVKELFLNLKLKDILETSEGRNALIDENKVTYFVQQGEWLGDVFVKHIDKNQVELKEID